MQLRLSASGRTAQQPRSYCTTLPCSKAQARYLSQNIGIVTNCKTLHAKENYKVVCRVLMHHRAEDAYALMSAHNVSSMYTFMSMFFVETCILKELAQASAPGFLGFGFGVRGLGLRG